MMAAINPRRIFSSLFSKLLLILVFAGLCINLLVVSFFVHHIRQATKDPFVRNVVNYLNYIIKDLGNPPDLEKAKAISSRYLMQIHYDGPDGSWHTDDTPLPSSFHHWRTMVEGKDFRVLVSRGRRMVTLYRDNARFTFLLGANFAADDAYVRMAVLVTIVTGVLLVSYLMLRWILKPIRWLHDGVGQVAAGNLDHRVPGNRSDQLGDLVVAFNQMTARIRNMLQDRDQLLLDVSHELRTPLTRMKVALEFLPDGHARDNIHDDIREMETMVTAILEEARLRHSQIVCQSIDLSELLQDVTGEFEKRRLSIDLQMDSKPVIVHAAPDLLKIVFRNIIDNAFKYSEPDGTPVTVNLAGSGSEAVVSVIDHGSGIPSEELPHIFEPFYRVDKSRSRSTGGYGIGLSLCKTIMDAHNGRIEVSSIPGKGTVVKLFFDANYSPYRIS